MLDLGTPTSVGMLNKGNLSIHLNSLRRVFSKLFVSQCVFLSNRSHHRLFPYRRLRSSIPPGDLVLV